MSGPFVVVGAGPAPLLACFPSEEVDGEKYRNNLLIGFHRTLSPHQIHSAANHRLATVDFTTLRCFVMTNRFSMRIFRSSDDDYEFVSVLPK